MAWLPSKLSNSIFAPQILQGRPENHHPWSPPSRGMKEKETSWTSKTKIGFFLIPSWYQTTPGANERLSHCVCRRSRVLQVKKTRSDKYYTVPIFHMTFMISLKRSSLRHQMPNPQIFFFSPGQTNWYLWQGVQCNLEQNLCRERPSLHLPLITGAWWWWRSFSVKKKLIYEEITPMYSSRRSSPIFWEQKICMKFSGKLSKITFFISLQQISRLMKSLPVTVRQLHLVWGRCSISPPSLGESR